MTYFYNCGFALHTSEMGEAQETDYTENMMMLALSSITTQKKENESSDCYVV